MIVELTCPQSKTDASVTNSTDNEYGDMKVFTCVTGYEYSDGSTEKVFRCDSRGEWYPIGDDTECQGTVAILNATYARTLVTEKN